MKKFVLFAVFIGVFALSLSACSEKSKETPSEEQATSQEEQQSDQSENSQNESSEK